MGRSFLQLQIIKKHRSNESYLLKLDWSVSEQAFSCRRFVIDECLVSFGDEERDPVFATIIEKGGWQFFPDLFFIDLEKSKIYIRFVII
jgi:hypothetical protein